MVIKTTCKLLFFLLINGIAAAQSSQPTFQWAKRAGITQFDYGYGISSDSAGNVFVSGKYEGNANFDGTYVSCAGNHDIFVAKYGPAGDFKWVRTAGGVWGDYARASACDEAGNVYITGEMEMTCDFGFGVKLNSHGDNDIFIAKYNTDGDLLWAKKLGGGPKSDRGYGITAHNGSVYLTGNFQGACTFEGIKINSIADRYDIFVAKYSSDGVFQWIRTAGGSGDDEGWAISHDQDGNIYTTGYITGTAYFSGTSVKSKGGRDVFVAKYNPAGSLMWVKRAGGSYNDYGKGITVDHANRVFITGGFRSRAYFDSKSIQSSGYDDIFIAGYTSSGNLTWVAKAGGTLDDAGLAIAVDGASNTYITGNYRGPATFGATTLSGVDAADIYFASYDVNGNFRWVLKAGGGADVSSGGLSEAGRSICTDPAGNVLATGNYRSNSTFGNTELAWWDHTDIFITKIGITPPLTTVITSPINNKSFPEPTNITINADASSVTGNITKVEFFQGTQKIGEDLAAPYSCKWMNVSAGNYALHTIATNDAGQTCTSSVVTITVIPCLIPTITPSGPTTMCADSVKLNANTETGFLYQWIKDGTHIDGAVKSSYMATVTGDYQVRITSGPCITWSAPTRVKIQSGLLSASITRGGPTSFCKGDSVTLFANTCTGYIYQWKKNGMDIPGATKAIYIAKDSGSYQVKIIQGPSVAWSALVHVTVNSCRSDGRSEDPIKPISGYAEKALSDDAFTMHVYPNPSTGSFSLEICLEGISEETIEIRVLNTMGQSVYGKSFAKKDGCVKETIELENNLATGVYFLQTKMGKEVESTRILLSR